jgi:hypothetical protein
MRKFIVQYLRDSTIVHEVECEEVFSHPWEVGPGEKRYVILSDYVKDANGKYPVWYSWALYDSEALAINAAAGDIRKSMEIWDENGKAKFNEQELIKKVAAITFTRLEKK